MVNFKFGDRRYLYWFPMVVGLLLLYVPTYQTLASDIWSSDEQGHGPIILLISMFLFWLKKDVFLTSETGVTTSLFGFLLLILGFVLYVVGRSQQVLLFEVGSQIVVLLSVIIVMLGLNAAKKLWFPLFFLVFMIPLPGSVVDFLTMPMKIAVSTLAEYVLYALEYPIARDGVILQVGYYKLLVADACAGLHTVFTLEAMGLLYLHLIKRDSFLRNVSLATLIIPISFVANTVRVIVLVLVTYYFGDEVGQGFVHDFAGFVLFGVALVLIIFTDSSIHFFEKVITRKRGVNDGVV